VTKDETGVVSVQALQHKVPKKAKQAYDHAAKLSKEGKYLEASRELERAIQIDASYADAHNNLGVQYMRLRRLEEAEREFRRAAELDPALAQAHANLATSAWFAGDLPRAEAEALRALALAPNDTQARTVLNAVTAGR
jgi:Flp pilus assembly protein TadD